MGLDLSALFSGVSRGLGSVTDIQLAEHLRQVAEQQQFAQRQQLADEAFGRDKELRILLDSLMAGREEERFGRETERRTTERGEDQALAERKMRLEYLQNKDDNKRQGELDEQNRQYKEWLMSKPGGGGTGQDRVASDAQIISAENSERTRLLKKRDSLEAEKRGAIRPTQRKEIDAQIALLTDEYIEEQARAAGKRVSGSLTGGASAPAGGQPTGDPAVDLMNEITGGAGPGVSVDRPRAIEDMANEIASAWAGGAYDVKTVADRLIALVKEGQMSIEEAKGIMERAKAIYEELRASQSQAPASIERDTRLESYLR